MLRIQIMTRLHPGIYKSAGGGETRVTREFTYGPRNLVKAYRYLLKLRDENKRAYGNIGCGHSWMQTTDGRQLNDLLVHEYPELSHAGLAHDVEAALLRPEQQAAFDSHQDEIAS